MFADRLQRSRTAQHPGRKHNDAAYHPKYSVDRNPRNAMEGPIHQLMGFDID